MKRKAERDDPSVDADGVRVVYDERGALRRGLPLIAIAVTAALAVLLLVRPSDRRTPPDEPHAGAVVTDTGPAARPQRLVAPPRPLPRPVTVRRVGEPEMPRRPPPERHDAADGETETERVDVDARDYIAALRDSGETEGLAAFPPPGTRPPRAGVIVPDDYVLPEGFARHYQSTDDGRRLPPILTLAPGYELLDDSGEPVSLIDDRIVPPEFAPPDLPVQMLEIPEVEPR